MNWGFGVSKHEDDDTKSGERGTDTRRKSRRTTFAGRRLFIFGALVVAAATLGPIAAFATHTTPNFPQLPLESPLTDTAKNPGLELDCASGSDISAVGTILGDQTNVDRDVSGSENRIRPGEAAPEAIWANATSYPGITVLDVSGQQNVIHGKVVSRSHLNVSGSENQFQHHTEYGQRFVTGDEAFNIPAADNCFSGPDADGAGTVYDPGEPAQVTRATPAQPDGFPVDFDLDNDGDFGDTFAPGSAAAIAAQNDPMLGNQYFTCLIGSSNIPGPLVCDISTGKLSGSVQGTQMPTGLWYAAGEVDIAASNLQATVTIVSEGKMKISGSSESDFIAYSSGLLFMSDFGIPNTVVGEDALDVSGSTSEFEKGHVFAPNGRVTLGGSQNSFQCTVMGDRVTLNGSLLFINGVVCAATAPSVVTEIHAETGNGHTNLGDSGSIVQVGTTIHDKIVIASSSNSNLVGTITLKRFNNADCTGDPAVPAATWTAGAGPPGPTGGTYAAATTVTIDSALPFTPATGVYSYQATYGGDVNNLGPVIGKCEGPVRVVDARISIDPDDVNRVGDSHTFTVLVEADTGAGFAPLNVAAVTVNLTAGAINVVDNCADGTGDAGELAGQCSVTFTSNTPGLITGSASATAAITTPQGSLNIPVTTTDANSPTGNAIKRFVDARISIDPDDVNRVGDSHTFTVLVEANDGTGWAAANVAAVTVGLAGGATDVVDNCADGTGDAGEDPGKCSVTFTRSLPGLVTGSASATVSLTTTQGNINLPVSTTHTNSPTGNAIKRFVDARISIDPDDVNRVGDSHTFTVLVEANDGTGWAAANVDAVTVNLAGDADSVVNTCTDGTGDAGELAGQCSVTFTSDTPGIVTGSASATVALTTAQGNINLPVATTDTNSTTGNAIKRFVNARIAIDPDDVNRVGDPHTFTVTVQADTGSGYANVDVAAVTVNLAGDADSVVNNCTNGTGDAADNEATGQCSVTFTSDTPGTVTGSASATVALTTPQGNINVPVATTDANSLTGNAIKRFVDARISIDPDDVNRVGESHTFTVLVESNSGGGWVATNVDAVTVNLAGDADSVVNSCTDGTGDAGEDLGKCSVTFTSDTPGIVTGSASATVALTTAQGNINLPVATTDTNSTTGNAIKRFVDARISIDPDDVNQVGESHTFTVLVESNSGSGWVATNVDAVTVNLAGDADSVVNTCTDGTGDAGEDAGKCSVTFTSDTPGIVTGSASATVALTTAQGNINLPVSTTDTNSPTGNAVKTFVNARISIDPDDVNRVGDSHTFIVLVEADSGSGFAPFDAAAVTVNLAGDADNVVNTCANGTGDAGDNELVGRCRVTFDSDTPGIVTGSATATVTIATQQGNKNVQVSTTDANSPTGNAIKRFVDARISIDPDDVNRVGDNHTFTVLVEANTGSGFAPVNVAAVTVNLAGDADSVVNNCTDGTGGAGELTGECSVTFTSDTPGIVTGSASATVALTTAQGNINLPVSTTDANSPTNNAIKRFVNARISIDPDETNGIGESHTFTVLVEANTGSGYAAADVATVTVNLAGDADSVVNTCTNGTGNDAGEAAGQCSVTFTSDTVGTVTGTASATVALTTAQGNINVPVSTADANSPTGPAVKTFIDGSLRWIKHDGQGQLLGGATFQVCLTHDRFGTDIVPDECVTVLDNSPLDTDPTGGEFQLEDLKLGRYTIDETVPPAGYIGDTFVETIELTLANPNRTATHTWVNTRPGATLLIIDEDSIDNGIHVNKTGENNGLITPDGPQFFSDTEVNDDIARYGQRTPLRYFTDQANFGKEITLTTGRTNDEGWFAPTCIPQKWLGGTSNNCLTNGARQNGINAFWGSNNSSTISQSRLDKIPAVMPLRALGLNSLVTKDVCAVVYDSDISINYVKSTFPFTNANLQGATLGIVAFTVIQTRTLNGFSSSTLPQVTIRINNPATCNPTELFNAPVPKSSSIPNDRIAPGSSVGYRQVKVYPNLAQFI